MALKLVFFFVLILNGLFSSESEKDLKDAVLHFHNEHRINAGLITLEWSSDLAKNATEYALEVSKRTNCGQVTKDVQSENLCTFRNESINATDAFIGLYCSRTFYSQLNRYSFPGESRSFDACKNSGYMATATGYAKVTQMMWMSTTQVGCGIQRCNNFSAVLVCYYDPPGNVKGAPLFLDENYRRVKGKEPKEWSSCDDKLRAVTPVESSLKCKDMALPEPRALVTAQPTSRITKSDYLSNVTLSPTLLISVVLTYLQ
ncbi:uncharacterized protein LOC142351781 [Convolutriloba macropyga]|uniref:uncharacterized protein LOC142351781 n=1 Tax=Convolutriloba macropyga TaxID=536237 RepID=UPI003F51D511